MSLMAPERVRLLDELVRQELGIAIARWQRHVRIVLFDELQLVLSRASREVQITMTSYALISGAEITGQHGLVRPMQR